MSKFNRILYNFSCSVDWESGGKLNNSYISFLFMMGFFLPLFVIAFASFQIIRTLRKVSSVTELRQVED